MGMGSNADLVIASGYELRKSATMLAFIRDLTDAVPEAAGVVSGRHLAKAMLEPGRQVQLERDIRELRTRYPDEIDRLLVQHGLT